MNKLSDITKIKTLLSKHGFNFSKSLGQNFLIDQYVCPRMAEESVPDSTYGVLEIGPGIGVLTYELAKKAKKVVAVELDKRLISILGDTLSEFDNIKIINDDILNLDLKAVIEKEFPFMPISVCANLPYYITSPVIMKLLEEKLPIDSLTVMVQKEAAERICAKPGLRAAGAISVAVHYYSEPQILFDVPRDSFIPSPNVDSAVIKLGIRKEPIVKVDNEIHFFRVVKSAFGQRRKTILNSLSAGLCIPKERIKAILDDNEIPEKSRAEQLSIEEFALISNSLFSKRSLK